MHPYRHFIRKLNLNIGRWNEKGRAIKPFIIAVQVHFITEN